MRTNGVRPGWLERLVAVNKELWLLLSLFAIAGLLNALVAAHHVVLGIYAAPTVFSAYFYGRRHAALTALASTLLVVLLTVTNPRLFGPVTNWQKWADLVTWGAILVVTAYAMGTLYEQKERQLRELRQTYHGVLLILSHFISRDKYTQNHSYRTSVYATQIASCMGMSDDDTEDIRAAALLHDIGKLEVSREILYKAARLTEAEFEQVKQHVSLGAGLLAPVGGSLRRVLPLILAHHDKFDGSGVHPLAGDDIPLGARIIAVADTYDALTSDRPYRRAMTPLEAKDIIEKEAGAAYDPEVVEGFAKAFRLGLLEIPEIMV